MAVHVLDFVAVLLGAAVVLGIVVTVVLVVRGRPSQAPQSRRPHNRVQGRSLRGWQASVLREIRRAGRPPRRRTPREKA